MSSEYEQLLARERAARAAVEAAADRTLRLQSIIAALTAALTPEQVTEVIVQQGVVILQASAGFVSLLTGDGKHLQIVGATGYDEATVRSWPPTPLTVATPTAHAIARARPIWIESTAALEQDYPQLAARPSLTGSRTFAALPLAGDHHPIGVLGFSFAEERSFSAQDRALMLSLAQYCALALERARLYTAERAAREAAETAQAQLALLAGASRTLATSLDYETTLRTVARLLVPSLADWCAIDLLGDDGKLYRAIVARGAPAKSKTIRLSRRSQPLAPAAAELIGEVLRSGRGLRFPTPAPETLEALSLDAATLHQLRRLRRASTLIVPLLGHERHFGAITLMIAASRRSYGEPDLVLAADLARRAGLALDNSRLYLTAQQAEQRIRQQAARLLAITEATHDFAATTFQWPELLDAVQRRIIAGMGDSCVISLLSADQERLSPVAFCHVDPARQRALGQHLGPAPFRIGEGPHGRVLQTGQPLLISRRRDKHADTRLDPRWAEVLLPTAESAIVILPLQNQETRGTVVIGRDASWPEFTRDDQIFLQEVVDRAALALANAELHRQLGEREQHLSALVGQLITSQEEERRRVAYEVHDGLAQVAVATHQHLQAFAHQYRPRSAEAHQALALALSLARQTVDEARQVIADLRPTVLDDFGLASALGIQVQALENAGWTVEYSETLGSERLPAPVETALFRVAQEALRNVRKHAQTTRVRVALGRDHRNVFLIVEDWGRGFVPGVYDSQTGPGERVGLPGMRERIALIGGRCQIDTTVGLGTRITAKVPLP